MLDDGEFVCVVPGHILWVTGPCCLQKSITLTFQRDKHRNIHLQTKHTKMITTECMWLLFGTF